MARPTLTPPVRTKLARALVAFTLICAIGGQWTILQSIAWVGMVVCYSQNATLAAALQKTFDGEHPCRLCLVIREGKKSERQQTFLKVESKLDLSLADETTLLDAPTTTSVLAAVISVPLPSPFEPPPTPPPRPA